MLATRIIPTLLQRGDQLVKGQKFNSWRSVGHVRQAIRIHQARGVDELIYLDISGGRPNFDLVRSFADECFMPLTVGGGVATITDARNLLNAGADKITVCSGGEALISEISRSFGAQAVIGVINYDSPNDVEEKAKLYESAGAGEILLQSIEREGMLTGYDLELINSVAHAVDIPVIAHGGCSGYEDMYQAIQAGASAVAAGALFQFTDCTPRGAAQYLASKGVDVRC